MGSVPSRSTFGPLNKDKAFIHTCRCYETLAHNVPCPWSTSFCWFLGEGRGIGVEPRIMGLVAQKGLGLLFYSEDSITNYYCCSVDDPNADSCGHRGDSCCCPVPTVIETKQTAVTSVFHCFNVPTPVLYASETLNIPIN